MDDNAVRRWRSLCPRAATPAVGAIALGRHLASRQASCLQAVPLLSSPLYGLATGTAPAAWPWVATLSGGPSRLQPVLQGPGHGRQPLQRAWLLQAAPFPLCVLYENAARMRRAILRDLISSHALTKVREIANSKDSVLMQELVHGRRSIRGHPKARSKLGAMEHQNFLYDMGRIHS
ncbi:hypothetical protein B296_00021868 [Ensete ventricosum]|uniref:Uncharacterized protein n=1 Tax=Ensete ventricosum TaxID=4639 RepID=A0A426X051_ENSVE|nr:hypothetical protein B296_00021868 [Ensete ventricosum]